jgi:hypothetical protein
MITDLVKNWTSICVNKNFAGIGSTRKVYRWQNYVLKVHLHEMGHLQSLRELEIYEYMKENGFGHIFAPTYFVNEKVCIQQYFEELPMYDYQTFDVNERNGFWEFPDRYKNCMQLLDDKFDAFDIRDSSNYGLNDKKELVLIDYGMSKKLYEEAWVPAAESGEVPQIAIDICECCGIEREIRMYGEHDQVKRCFACGKE